MFTYFSSLPLSLLSKCSSLSIRILCRKGERQPDNFEGIKHGPINAENNIGITIEGLQEFHDEACLAVLNDKYNDGITWHDVACHYRSIKITEKYDDNKNCLDP